MSAPCRSSILHAAVDWSGIAAFPAAAFQVSGLSRPDRGRNSHVAPTARPRLACRAQNPASTKPNAFTRKKRRNGPRPKPGPSNLRASLKAGPRGLLELDLGADLLQSGLDLLGLFLRHAFLDRLGRAFDEILGLLEAERGDRADFLDDLDLLVADGGQNDGELGLLFDRSGGGGRAPERRRPLPRRRPKRPTWPRAAWRARRLQERSGSTVRRRFFRD